MTYRKKLIEVALPLEDINREAAREKSIRHGHPSTLHLWWARRPLAACRAVLFASLVDDPSECVEELLADATKRGAAEKLLSAQRKAWKPRKELFDKADAAGISAPDPGPEPKLEEIIVATDRERLFDIIRELVKWENSNNDRVLNAARAEIMRSCNGKPPPVYDPFCGGGSIPLEAQRLGLEAHASDLNPVPVLITKALIELPPKFVGRPPVNPDAVDSEWSAKGAKAQKYGKKADGFGEVRAAGWKGAAGLAADIRYYGRWMRDEAERRIGYLYPKVSAVRSADGAYRHATPEEIAAKKAEELTVIAWLWARTVASPNPAAKGAHVPLVRSFWLSTKAGKKAWVEPIVDQTTMTYRLVVRSGNGEPRAGTIGTNGDSCLITGSPMTREYIRSEGKAGRMGVRLLGNCCRREQGRIYLSPNQEQEQLALGIRPPDRVPDTDIIGDMRYLTPVTYGMTKHRQLFTNRQLVALMTFCDLVGEARANVLRDSHGDEVYADAIATYLAMVIGKIANLGSSLTSWMSDRGAFRETFARQALCIVWDFAEANPLTDVGGGLATTIEKVAKVAEFCRSGNAGFVSQLSATEIVQATPAYLFPPTHHITTTSRMLTYPTFFTSGCAIVCNDSIHSYSAPFLCQRQRSWSPTHFVTALKTRPVRFSSAGWGRVFRADGETSDPRFPTTIYYAFKQTEDDGDDENGPDETKVTRASTGWETFLQGLADEGWQIDGTWPMRTEGQGRLRGLNSNALASSIILVCRHAPMTLR